MGGLQFHSGTKVGYYYNPTCLPAGGGGGAGRLRRHPFPALRIGPRTGPIAMASSKYHPWPGRPPEGLQGAVKYPFTIEV